MVQESSNKVRYMMEKAEKIEEALNNLRSQTNFLSDKLVTEITHISSKVDEKLKDLVDDQKKID